MKNPKFWLAVLAAGVVANILDFLLWPNFLMPMMAGIESMRPEGEISPVWYIIGDFIAVFVMMLVYDRVYSSFSPGAAGGATYGLYVGILTNFPMWIFVHLMFKGFPYGMAWGLIVIGIIWTVIVGAVLGATFKKKI
ncbi:MAG: hypothetical protein OEV30_10535 [Ignavibacteria bacterium]|nr:hypothetical protein [Ignavibacteria bacterium]